VHAIAILHRCLEPLLHQVHRRRLRALFEAVASSVIRPRVTPIAIGRRLGSAVDLRHRIKRADRLLGNVQLQRQTHTIYAALARAGAARRHRRAADRDRVVGPGADPSVE
jgi:hypothetical protein